MRENTPRWVGPWGLCEDHLYFGEGCPDVVGLGEASCPKCWTIYFDRFHSKSETTCPIDVPGCCMFWQAPDVEIVV